MHAHTNTAVFFLFLRRKRRAPPQKSWLCVSFFFFYGLIGGGFMFLQAEDFLPGTSVVGKSAAWFFNSASPGFQPSGLSDGGSSAEEASVFVGGGVGSSSGTAGEKDVSRNVRELRWRRGEGGDTHACLVICYLCVYQVLL